MKSFFKKIKLPKLPRLPKPKRLNLSYKLLIAFFILIILFISIYALGIYQYRWTRYGTKTVVKFIPYPAAFVGPSWITVAEFEEQKTPILHFYLKTGTPLENERELDRQILDNIIAQKLTEREFRKQGLFITQKEVEDEYKRIVEENQGEENVKQMLNDLYGVSPKDFKKNIQEKFIVEKFKNEVLVSVHLWHIVIKDQSRANDVLNQLKNGADFAELAKKFSEDELSRDKGGDLGFVQRGSLLSNKPMPNDLEQAIFSLNAGEISSAPVASEYGFHIFKVTEKKGKIDKSYENWLSETKSKIWIKKFIGK